MATKAASQEVLPPEEAAALAALDEAKRAIQVALANEDVESLLEMRDRVAAAQHYFRRREEARELADNAGELKVRAEAALGRLDLAVAPRPGRRKAEEVTEDGDGEDEPAPVSPLADFQPNRRSMFRTLGRLEHGQLDEVVVSLRSDEDERGVTTARAVKVARDLLPHDDKGAADKPTKEVRRELVTDYVAHLRALDTETSTLVRMARKVIPAATPGERSRMANRLANTIARLDDLKEGLDMDAEPADADVEDE